MNVELQKDAKAEPHPKQGMRFIYFGRMKKLNFNKKDEEYVQHVHDGVTCVGYQIAETGDLVVGVSFCSPADQFSKKKARMIIKGRMAIGKAVMLPDVGDKSYTVMSYEELIAEIRECLNHSYDADSAELAGVPWPLWFQGV
jgi:hypothetical protein